jgi:hypothetical protein
VWEILSTPHATDINGSKHNSNVELEILTSATVEQYCLLGCDAVQSDWRSSMLRRTNCLHFVVETSVNLRQTSKSHIPEDTGSTLQNYVCLRLFYAHKRNCWTGNNSHKAPAVHIRINRKRLWDRRSTCLSGTLRIWNQSVHNFGATFDTSSRLTDEEIQEWTYQPSRKQGKIKWI